MRESLGLARITVVDYAGHEHWNKVVIRKNTMQELELTAEWWIKDCGARYVRLDTWHEGIKDWAVYKEYAKGK